MDIYELKETCPYYGDVTIVGMYSSDEKLNKAKEIVVRCSRIDGFEGRLSVDKYSLDMMPYDSDKGE